MPPVPGFAESSLRPSGPVSVQTARKVDPPARFVDGVKAQNSARAEVRLQPLVWSTAREDEARDALASLTGSCSSSKTERMGVTKDVSVYFSSPMRMLDGVNAIQELSGAFVVSEWLQQKSHYDPVAGCDRKGSCEAWIRMSRPSARTVGCAITTCADRSQIWACKYGD